MSISNRLKDRIGKIASAPTMLTRMVSRTAREKTFRTGAIVLEDGERVPVIIKDISERGARIEFVQHIELPASVTLIEPTMKRRQATVAWQRDGVAGLHF
jgi:hypothetical protein